MRNRVLMASGAGCAMLAAAGCACSNCERASGAGAGSQARLTLAQAVEAASKQKIAGGGIPIRAEAEGVGDGMQYEITFQRVETVTSVTIDPATGEMVDFESRPTPAWTLEKWREAAPGLQGGLAASIAEALAREPGAQVHQVELVSAEGPAQWGVTLRRGPGVKIWMPVTEPVARAAR